MRGRARAWDRTALHVHASYTAALFEYRPIPPRPPMCAFYSPNSNADGCLRVVLVFGVPSSADSSRLHWLWDCVIESFIAYGDGWKTRCAHIICRPCSCCRRFLVLLVSLLVIHVIDGGPLIGAPILLWRRLSEPRQPLFRLGNGFGVVRRCQPTC
jgi:hypothetical protein